MILLVSSVEAASLVQGEPPENNSSQIEVISPYFSIDHRTTPSGHQLTGAIINGPSRPLPEYQAEREASMTAITPQGILPDFPSYDWVFGCSAVSGAMIAAWYDRGAFPNIYTGPTNGGLMPITDTGWSTWSDNIETYPNNPLVASHQGSDGRTIRGSIDDYWIKFDSELPDPYVDGGWTQHSWGSAIGDYMKTSQSAYGNNDGATLFFTWTNAEKLTCDDMVGQYVSTLDGTYGRKLFYEARGYSVGDCYNQKTDNNSGNFTLENFKAEIDAGHPVLINLSGHSVVGYGYNGSTIYIRDNWDSNPAHTYTMSWGGIYQGMSMVSVSVVHLNQHTYKQFLPMIQNVHPVPVANNFLNPGFEEGPASWTESSFNGWDLILEGEDYNFPAHSGEWLAWLGGSDSETSLLTQTINITAATPYLHFWYWSASASAVTTFST